jgi:predicted ArsR family transcriptional regulator
MPERRDDLARLAALDEPVRRRLYEFVRSRGEPVGRDEAGSAVGVGRSLAAYHLDRLVDEGFLATTYARPAGRSGPGAGRPAKLYEPAGEEVAVTVPARDYEFVAGMLADAVESEPGGATRDSLRETAAQRGRELGLALRSQRRAGTRSVRAALAERGYEPFEDERGEIRLRNCPFHRLAAEHRDLVCGMNQAFLSGLLEGLDRSDLEAFLEPEPGRCCVTIR